MGVLTYLGQTVTDEGRFRGHARGTCLTSLLRHTMVPQVHG